MYCYVDMCIRKVVYMNCDMCGKLVSGRRRNVNTKHFCSNECYQQWRKENIKWSGKYNVGNQMKLKEFARKRRNSVFKPEVII